VNPKPAKDRAVPRELVDHLERLFSYDAWANREVLESMHRAAPSARALKLVNHVVAAELLWLARLEKQEPPCPVWPDWDLAECEKRLLALPRQWRDFFADVEPADLAVSVEYVNSKKQPFSSRVDDVLTHVVMHSAYHRGQIAAETRASGHEPAYTDFIHCARSGLLDGEE
jgi:uncharacterized damage-inducible protein DinB